MIYGHYQPTPPPMVTSKSPKEPISLESLNTLNDYKDPNELFLGEHSPPVQDIGIQHETPMKDKTVEVVEIPTKDIPDKHITKIKHTEPETTKHIQTEPIQHVQTEPTKLIEKEPKKHTKPETTKHIQTEPSKDVGTEPIKHVEEKPTKHIEEPKKHIDNKPTKHVENEPTKHIDDKPKKYTYNEPTKHIEEPKKQIDDKAKKHADNEPTKHVQTEPTKHVATETPKHIKKTVSIRHIETAPTKHTEKEQTDNEPTKYSLDINPEHHPGIGFKFDVNDIIEKAETQPLHASKSVGSGKKVTIKSKRSEVSLVSTPSSIDIEDEEEKQNK